MPDPVPDVPNPVPPRQMRPAQRPVNDPHAFYPNEEGPEFSAKLNGIRSLHPEMHWVGFRLRLTEM